MLFGQDFYRLNDFPATVSFMKALTEQYVRSLIKNGESESVEFKRRRKPGHFNDKELVEACVCLANGAGGTLLIGVEDDGAVSGSYPFHGKETQPQLLQALIQNRTSPQLDIRAGVHTVDNKEIVVVQVAQSAIPACTSEGKYLHRVIDGRGNPTCMPLEPHQLFTRYREASDIDWATLPAHGASWEDIDERAIENFRNNTPEDVLKDLTVEQLLNALGLVRMGQITLGAILMFGRPKAIEEWVPNHQVLVNVLKGTEVIRNESYIEPLLLVMDRVLDVLDQYIAEEEIFLGAHRVGLPSVPTLVIREAIANAMAHRMRSSSF